jgi:hypothetical protein
LSLVYSKQERRQTGNISATNKGVSFDIAVTSGDSSGNQAHGAAKAGFIEVLGANVGTKMEQRKESSQVSRIQFSVYVPPRTEQEQQAAERQSRTDQFGEDMW